MIFKKIQVSFHDLIPFLWVIHCILSLLYGYQMPWGGDEWYTYNDYVVIGTPNNLLVMLLKWILGPVNVGNYMIYRQVGLFWMMFIFVITFFLLKKDTIASSARKFLILNIIFITFSPFVFFQEQYFRYYGLYLLVSFICNIAILLFNVSYAKKRWIFYLLLIISPLIHYLLTWQLVFYILWKEWSLLNLKNKVFFGSMLGLAGAILLFNWNQIFRWFMHLGSIYSLTEGGIRGWNKATIVKPLVSIFQYFFGEDLVPLENWFVMFLFLFLMLLVCYGMRFLLIGQSKNSILDFSFASIFPFLSMFLFLEPMTLPGATQLIAKHGLFILSWLVVLLIPGIFHTHNWVKWFSRLTLGFSLFYGSVFSIAMNKENWHEVVKVASDETMDNSTILVHGRSEKNFLFYADNTIDSSQIINFYDTSKLSVLLDKSEFISIVLNDYRAYQMLSKEQMWNTGTGSGERFSRIQYLFSSIEKRGFRATNSYTFFPLMCFRFEKDTNSENHYIPWYYNIKYQGIKLPVYLDNKDTLLGWKPINAPFDIAVETFKIYYFIELVGETRQKSVLEISYADGSSSRHNLNSEHNVYRKFADRRIENSENVYRWHKRPLLSTSLAYPGSWLPSTGFIYLFKSKKKISRIKCDDSSVNFHLFVTK